MQQLITEPLAKTCAGLSAPYHRLQVCSTLLVLAELRVLPFDDPIILVLEERRTTTEVATTLFRWATSAYERRADLVLFHQRHHVCDLVLTLELHLVLVFDGFRFGPPEPLHLLSTKLSLLCVGPEGALKSATCLFFERRR